MPRILLTTVYKPFGIDSPFSRKDSFPECLHNRLTRDHGIFSYRSHYNAFGLHSIANNISAASTVLEYPSLKRFEAEVRQGYDYVGIGSVVANFQKVRVMAETVRRLSPRAKIVVGGYCARIDQLQDMVPIDYLCTGDGISFMRELLGDPPDFRFHNADIFGRGHSFLGVPLFGLKHPHIITGLGCPYGCEYCAPSHHFGRQYIRFYQTGRALFEEMERMEERFKSRTISFLGDDNFLLDFKRADQLRECIVKSGKQYELFYFCSADKIQEFGPARMAEMGTNLVWIGRESCLIEIRKRGDADLKLLVDDLHRHGIKVVISGMLLMEHHTPENIWVDINDQLGLQGEFNMLSFYTAFPGTPFYDRMKQENRLLTGYPYEDWNGLWRPNFHHPHFSPAEAIRVRNEALHREYHELGPSAMRLIRTDLEGYLHLRESNSELLRRRAQHLAGKMPRYRALLWAMARLAPTPEMRDMIEDVRARLERTFGPTTAWEKTQGAGLWGFGTKEKVKQRFLGDVIQPPTLVSRYPGRPGARVEQTC